jgi:hypothetical protein
VNRDSADRPFAGVDAAHLFAGENVVEQHMPVIIASSQQAAIRAIRQCRKRSRAHGHLLDQLPASGIVHSDAAVESAHSQLTPRPEGHRGNRTNVSGKQRYRRACPRIRDQNTVPNSLDGQQLAGAVERRNAIIC